MIKKTSLIAIVAFYICLLPIKDAKAQFSMADSFEVLDLVDFLIDNFVPLPEIVKAGKFAVGLSLVPSRITIGREIEHGPPNIIEISTLYNNESESPLYPDSDDDEFKEFQFFIKKLSSFQSEFGFAKFVSSGRTVLGSGGNSDNSLIGEKYFASDSLENYFQFTPTSTTSFHFGRRNEVFGHSFGINPANVFSFSRSKNYNLPFDRKHLESSGTDTFGFEYYSSIGKLTALVEPKFSSQFLFIDNEDNEYDNRYYLSYGNLFGSEPIDLRLFSLYDGEPLAGISVNAPAPKDFTLYTDLAVKQGNGIQRVLNESESGMIQLDSEEKSQFIANVTVGMNYTFGRDLLVNAEYSHQTNGYDESEWNSFYSALEEKNSGGKKLQDGVFDQLKDNYNSSYLRRDYGYLRFFDQDTFGTGIKTEVATLIGLNDFSGRVDLNLSRNITEAYSLEAYAGYNFGQSDGEFALARENILAGVSIVAKY